MRTARIVEEGAAYYHVISRVVGREFVFAADMERERFRATLRAVEAFSGMICARFATCGSDKQPVPDFPSLYSRFDIKIPSV